MKVAAGLLSESQEAVDAKSGDLDGLVAATDAAEANVKTQRDRVEALVRHLIDQGAEATAWAERVDAAQDVRDEAFLIHEDAVWEQNSAEAQVSQRSWLYPALSYLDATNWVDGCDADACLYKEDVTSRAADADANTSEWAWPNDGLNCNVDSGNKCLFLGLRGDSTSDVEQDKGGLIEAATAALGNARNALGDAAAPTAGSLEETAENADYTYSSGTSLLTTALTKFEAWVDAEMWAKTMMAACWKVDNTEYAWCKTGETADGSTNKYHPLIQGTTASPAGVAT